ILSPSYPAPERRAGDRDLRIIPHEIYLAIFKHIAPTSGPLHLRNELTLFQLSRVCKFFRNLSLPPIFDYITFYDPTFDDHQPLLLRKNATSKGVILCRQIAAKEPLALFLAQCVKVCHFEGWQPGRNDYGGAQMSSRIYVSGLAHMRNIRELKFFFRSFVNNPLWDVIANLESL
ncbi:hypothetical protein BU15DRAFT_14611, partial [Melanogaster broomeanus]